MERFEYETRKISESEFDRFSTKETRFLDNQGTLGWELVSVVPSFSGDASVYYFKKKITEGESPKGPEPVSTFTSIDELLNAIGGDLELFLRTEKRKLEKENLGLYQAQTKAYELIKPLLTKGSIIVNAQVAVMLQDNPLFQNSPTKTSLATETSYKIGTIDGCIVSVDPNLKWADLKVRDKDNNTLIDLADHFHPDQLFV